MLPISVSHPVVSESLQLLLHEVPRINDTEFDAATVLRCNKGLSLYDIVRHQEVLQIYPDSVKYCSISK